METEAAQRPGDAESGSARPGDSARTLYQMQLNTTLSRFFDQEQAQLSRPVARRSAAVFGNLADAISADAGVKIGRAHV